MHYGRFSGLGILDHFIYISPDHTHTKNCLNLGIAQKGGGGGGVLGLPK